jgi:hypothetical protein
VHGVDSAEKVIGAGEGVGFSGRETTSSFPIYRFALARYHANAKRQVLSVRCRMQNRILGLLVVLTAAPAFGGERKANTLTPEEIRNGWILLFDGDTPFGWRNEPAVFPKVTIPLGWKLGDGMLQIPDEYGGTSGPHGVASTSNFGEFKLSFEYGVDTKGTKSAARFDVRGPNDRSGAGHMFSNPLQRTGGQLKTFVFDVERKLFTVPPYELSFSCGDSKRLSLRSIKLRPLNMNPLFNGKNLTGWKPFPGKKSKFEVKEGAITIIDGPGDAQTAGKYRDFILQLECKSNGKHLNSGVFFRCRDGEYQNGYEAQIRNQFTAEPKQVYTIEEYDAKTHELVGKKKMKYTAVDYGTGAIYRRQPARREVAKDGEWFTMTILAHGNHFATWVNGVQVTDWTDNRPPSDNARTGFRREAGHISLQGHDPTTNLSFRNVRIADLK